MRSTRSRSSSPWGEPLSPRARSPPPGNDGAPGTRGEEKAEDEEEREARVADEGRWLGPDAEKNGEGKSPPSPREESRSKSSSPKGDRASTAGSEERGQDDEKEEREA